MESSILVVNAIVIGLVGGIIPGPILASAFLESIVSGFKKSVNIILWGMLNETIVAIFCLVVLRLLNLPEVIFYCLSIIGGILLFDISIKLWKVKHIQIETSNILTLKKISYLILTNGVLWVYWISVCIPLALQLEKNILGGSFLFLFLVEISWFISTLVATYLFSKTKSLIYDTKKQLRIVRVFSVVYIYFVVIFFYTIFKYLYKYFL